MRAASGEEAAEELAASGSVGMQLINAFRVLAGGGRLVGMGIEIVESRIDTEKLLRAVADDECGAAVLFLGTTRRWTGDQYTQTLRYDAHREMAAKQLSLLREEAMRRWPARKVAVAHRLGEVPVGEASVAVAVASPHRDAAFEAARWLIDTLKRDVPIWKQEVDAEGNAQWVHPQPVAEP